MDLHYDITLGYLVPFAGSRSPLKSMLIKRGDDTPLNLRVQRNGEAGTLTGSYAIKFVIKATPGAGINSLAEALTWTEAAGVYSAELNTNGVALDTLLGNDRAKSLLAEVTITDDDGGPRTSRLVTCTVENDLYRGDEGTPIYLPDPEEWMKAAVAAATDTAKLALTDLAAGQLVNVTGEGGRIEQYLGGDESNQANWAVLKNTVKLYAAIANNATAAVNIGGELMGDAFVYLGWVDPQRISVSAASGFVSVDLLVEDFIGSNAQLMSELHRMTLSNSATYHFAIPLPVALRGEVNLDGIVL